MRPLVLAVLAGCVTPPEPTHSGTPTTTGQPTTGSSTGDTSLTPPGPDLSVLALPEAVSANTGRVATATLCDACHANAEGTTALRDEAGRPVGPFTLWQGTMMANSARDPLWRAMVSAEVAAVPEAAATIEATCTRCHAPMASIEAELTGAPAPTLEVLSGADKVRYALAVDGVSCTACHQIEATGLGTEESFDGGFTTAEAGVAYGPYGSPRTSPMAQMSGFTPAQGDHILESALCATCHTLRTHSLGLDGTPDGGEVLEQAPYLEWLVSDHDDQGTSCQDCHLPTTSEDGVTIETPIAHAPNGSDFRNLPARSPVARHLLVGGNTLVPQILDGHRDLFQPLATSDAFEATLDAARDQLAHRTATVAIHDPALVDRRLSFDVQITSLTGHKFPSGIPLRRAWLHTVVRGPGGATVFESGAWDAAGRLLDGAGAVLPSEQVGGPVAPHVTTVNRANTVPVYEAVLMDVTGAPTWRLLGGAGYHKDNRLLPTGWDPAQAASYGIGPAGVSDPDFEGGGDVVHYAIDLPPGAGPLTVEVALRFQTLSARAAAELFETGTPEAVAFQILQDGVDQTEWVDSASVTIP